MTTELRSAFMVVAILSLLGPALVDAGAQQAATRISWDDALDQESHWYGSAEAVRIAENVLLYQHENGGWEKNIDMAAELDGAGRARVLAGRDGWQTTIDNGATHGQIRFLARVYAATRVERYRESALYGIEYLLESQYPSGGWPQFYPIREGYWQHITLNDGAMIGVMELLREVAEADPLYSFVPDDLQKRSESALRVGVEMILKAQIVANGVLTAWCAQHDEIDLRPRGARAYELPSISGSESVGVLRFLMEIENPDPSVVRAVQAAVGWLHRVRLNGIRVERREDSSLPGGYDLVVVTDPTAQSLWARFYEIGSDRPIFSGRDGVKKYSLAEIEHERRVGYSWLGPYARTLLERDYPAWQRRWAPDQNVLETR